MGNDAASPTVTIRHAFAVLFLAAPLVFFPFCPPPQEAPRQCPTMHWVARWKAGEDQGAPMFIPGTGFPGDEGLCNGAHPVRPNARYRFTATGQVSYGVTLTFGHQGTGNVAGSMFHTPAANAFSLMYRIGGEDRPWETVSNGALIEPMVTTDEPLCFGVNDWLGPSYWREEWYADNGGHYGVAIKEELLTLEWVPYQANCGDECLSPNEACDDGNASNNDACVGCTLARCGDGFHFVGTEECDDGNAVDGDTCDSNCTTPRCGNGVTAGNEDCDDANQDNSDGCTSTCVSPAELRCRQRGVDRCLIDADCGLARENPFTDDSPTFTCRAASPCGPINRRPFYEWRHIVCSPLGDHTCCGHHIAITTCRGGQTLDVTPPLLCRG